MRREKIYFASAIILLVLAAILGACAAPSAPTVAPGPQNTQTTPEVLVDVAWLQAHLNDPDVVILDVSSQEDVYRQGHVPGALFVDWRKDLVDVNNPVKGQVLTREQAERLFGRLGIDNTDTVVVYGDTNNLFAARAFWVLTYYGHEKVRLLDGGRQAWVQAGLELSTDSPEVTPTTYTIQRTRDELRADVAAVQALTDDSAVILDVRSPKEYAGLDVRARRGGHIPGAINVNWVAAVNSDGTFKSVDALAPLYQAAGVQPDKPVVTYCQTGVRAAHSWFVLTYLLGYPDVKVYDGSWEEWGNNPNLPIER